MLLKKIYSPIQDELKEVEQLISSCLSSKRDKFPLVSGGKRIRPALVLLSAKASQGKGSAKLNKALINIAAAVELVHNASLLHDDVLDRARLRHNQPTINSCFGDDVSITLGDYLYSIAFELLSHSANMKIIRSLSQAAKDMCEGELNQVCERDNLDLLKKQYILIIKQKTASLFAASCYCGSLMANTGKAYQEALKDYGLNFGIAFQIIDDYLDLTSEEKALGKAPGADIAAGEITLPVINLLENLPLEESRKLKKLLSFKKAGDALRSINKKIISSRAVQATKRDVSGYVSLAKKRITILENTPYKRSLVNLADYVAGRAFNIKVEV